MRQPIRKNRKLDIHKVGGFFFIELAIALMTLTIILAGMAMSTDGFRRFNHYQLARQQCTAAALGQLDSITATGRRIDPVDIERLWPNVELEVTESPGTDQWSGLTLVKVVAKAKSLDKDVEIRQHRYVRKAQSESESK